MKHEKSYKPLWDRVWVQKLEEEEVKSAGGLVLPGNDNKSYSRARVLAHGRGYKQFNMIETQELLVDVDDIVIFPKYSGVVLDNDTLILKEEEILAIEK